MQLNDELFYLRKRYLVASLLFVGYVVLFVLRINLSVCMVDMTSNRTVVQDNETVIYEPEYQWTPSQKGMMLSSFSWGFLTAPLTVMIVDKFGAVRMFGLAILVTGIITILSPCLIHYGLHVYIAGRFIEGVSEGIAISASYGIFAAWIPPKERSTLINVVLLGMPAGTAIGYPLSGYINYIFNWKYVFYVTGGQTVIWYLLWASFVRKSPSVDFLITKTEKKYLESVTELKLPKEKTKKLHLWKSMLTSKPTLAFLNEAFVESWSVSFLTYFLPFFIQDMHGVSIEKIGILSCLPHICDVMCRLPGSWFQDYLRCKGTMSKTKIHKMYILFGQVSAVVLLILIGFVNNFYASIIIFCIFKIAFTMAELSYMVLTVELAGQHSASMESLVILSMSLGYILNPLIMNFMVVNHSQAEWSHYFWFLCLFNLWGLGIFSRYGSAELQPWAQPEKAEKVEDREVSTQ